MNTHRFGQFSSGTSPTVLPAATTSCSSYVEDTGRVKPLFLRHLTGFPEPSHSYTVKLYVYRQTAKGVDGVTADMSKSDFHPAMLDHRVVTRCSILSTDAAALVTLDLVRGAP